MQKNTHEKSLKAISSVRGGKQSFRLLDDGCRGAKKKYLRGIVSPPSLLLTSSLKSLPRWTSCVAPGNHSSPWQPHTPPTVIARVYYYEEKCSSMNWGLGGGGGGGGGEFSVSGFNRREITGWLEVSFFIVVINTFIFHPPSETYHIT